MKCVAARFCRAGPVPETFPCSRGKLVELWDESVVVFEGDLQAGDEADNVQPDVVTVDGDYDVFFKFFYLYFLFAKSENITKIHKP